MSSVLARFARQGLSQALRNGLTQQAPMLASESIVAAGAPSSLSNSIAKQMVRNFRTSRLLAAQEGNHAPHGASAGKVGLLDCFVRDLALAWKPQVQIVLLTTVGPLLAQRWGFQDNKVLRLLDSRPFACTSSACTSYVMLDWSAHWSTACVAMLSHASAFACPNSKISSPQLHCFCCRLSGTLSSVVWQPVQALRTPCSLHSLEVATKCPL